MVPAHEPQESLSAPLARRDSLMDRQAPLARQLRFLTEVHNLANMSRIVAGKYDELTTIAPSVAYDKHRRRVPNPQPGLPGGS